MCGEPSVDFVIGALVGMGVGGLVAIIAVIANIARQS